MDGEFHLCQRPTVVEVVVAKRARFREAVLRDRALDGYSGP
jgi:hypothetical protein